MGILLILIIAQDKWITIIPFFLSIQLCRISISNIFNSLQSAYNNQSFNFQVIQNPCQSGSGPCRNGGLCSFNQTLGTYSCQCPSRTLSGKNCEIDECASKNCPENSKCIYKNGQTHCACLPGYKGNSNPFRFLIWVCK